MSCHSSTPTRAHSRVAARRAGLWAAALLFASITATAVGAQQEPDDPLSRSAREILAVHCPPCRDVGAATAPASQPRPLDLAAIARDPNLVRPGNPDGSPVYTEMMRRLALPGTQPATSPHPGLEALATLRAWIESLPTSAATCPHASDLTRPHIEPLLVKQAALMRRPVSALRVLTLAHLDASCLTAERLAGWREAIGLFMAALAGSNTPVPILSLDEKSHHLAVDIEALRWDSNYWRTLTGAGARASRSVEPLIVRADWLIVHVLRGEFGARFAQPSDPPAKPRRIYDPEISAEDRAIVQAMLVGATPSETLAHNTEIILQLARAHLAPAGLSRVASELGVAREVLEHEIAASAGGAKSLLLRLAYGTVPREDIEDSWLQLGRIGGAGPPARTIVPVQFDLIRPSITAQTPIELTIYADRARYAVGDAVQLTVRSNVNCRLTAISIDVSGHGTVIYPNEFIPRDLLSAHLNLVLPARDSGYRFRVKEKGRERVVALCTRAPGIIEGIEHDFERQRFQELGPYTAHLEAELKKGLKRRAAAAAEAAEAVKERASSDTANAPGWAAPPAASGPSSGHHAPLQQIWRNGIVIEVD
jgi:Domain of unknown function (DUF4384)